jgi:hypothetical protein
MIDYALAGDTEPASSVVIFTRRLYAAISQRGGTTEWLFPDLVEQRRCKKICGATIKGEP